MDSLRPVAVVADSHELFRAGLAITLRNDLGFEEVLGAASLDEAMHSLSQVDGDLASFEPSLPGMGGADGFRRVRGAFPNVRIVAISASTHPADMLSALGAGIHGYIPKTFALSEVTRALRLVLERQIYVPPSLADMHPLERDRVPDAEGAGERIRQRNVLTQRQREVLDLIAAGKTNRQIASELALAGGTVQAHINALFRVLGVRNRRSAAMAVCGTQLPQATSTSCPSKAETWRAEV